MTQEDVDAILKETSERMTMICRAASDNAEAEYCYLNHFIFLSEANCANFLIYTYIITYFFLNCK